MKGNAQYYKRKTLEEEKELRKLVKAKRKYQNILDDIERSIEKTEELLERDTHCLTLQMAEGIDSNIV